MPGPDPIQILRTRQELIKRRGGRDGLFGLLEYSTWDVVRFFDDFLGDKIQGSETGGATQASGIYEINTGVDGAINILADQPNGVAELRASDGAGANDEYAGLSLPELAFTGQRSAVMAVRLAIDTTTTYKVEVGFVDATTHNGAVNDLGANSATATDAAVWVVDTDDGGNWQNFGVEGGTTATKIEDGLSPTAGTFETLVVALREYDEVNSRAAAKFLRLDANGNLTYESVWMRETDVSGALSSTAAMIPWVFVQVRDAVDRNVQIDFIDVRARRTT